ncbi:MAG: hypothetical protein NC324_02265 [Bacteroides sp.]|nr:hypothetical protein [Bacteroides sp.]
MGIGSKLKAARSRAMISGFVNLVSGYLTGLLAGVPLDRENGEAEAVIMLSPGKRDTEVYIVVLSVDRQITRVCKKYSAGELGGALSGKMQAAGVDLGGMVQSHIPDTTPDEPLNEEV